MVDGNSGAALSPTDLVPVVREALSQIFSFKGPEYDGGNLLAFRRLATALDSAMFLENELYHARVFDGALELLEYCFKQASIDGLLMEFGVFSGRTINFLAGLTASKIFGFDSFQGLPEDWRPDFRAGAFQTSLPPVAGNVELVVGWFNETLPKFLGEIDGTISFLHVDCDLYSSTKTIFDACGNRIRSGTVIVFDEYFNYHGWRHGEYQAFEEFIKQSGLKFEYLGVVPSHQQVAVRIL